MQDVRELTWEKIDDGPGLAELIERARVPGGWLVAVVRRTEHGPDETRALTFVPDPPNAVMVTTIERMVATTPGSA